MCRTTCSRDGRRVDASIATAANRRCSGRRIRPIGDGRGVSRLCRRPGRDSRPRWALRATGSLDRASAFSKAPRGRRTGPSMSVLAKPRRLHDRLGGRFRGTGPERVLPHPSRSPVRTGRAAIVSPGPCARNSDPAAARREATAVRHRCRPNPRRLLQLRWRRALFTGARCPARTSSPTQHGDRQAPSRSVPARVEAAGDSPAVRRRQSVGFPETHCRQRLT